MPDVVFLTGAPGSGKSTLARLLADERPLSLLLDLDVRRGQLGGWRADPGAAGVRARLIGRDLARAQLEAGGDVIVPQFLRRPELIEQFRDFAGQTGSRFVLLALVSSPSRAAGRFAARARSPEPAHRDAAFLQDAPGAASIEELYADMISMLAGFPETRYVESVDGDVSGTLAAVRVELSDPGRYQARDTTQ